MTEYDEERCLCGSKRIAVDTGPGWVDFACDGCGTTREEVDEP